MSALGPDRYAQGLEVRMQRVERALRALARARRKQDTAGLPDPGELRERWPALDLAERRRLIAGVIDCAFVKPRDAKPRVHVCTRGTAPPDLPRPYRHEKMPFDPASVPAPPRAPTSFGGRRPDHALRAELDPFLAGRDEWPGFIEFQRAGLGLLHHALTVAGGLRRWRAEYGLRVSCGPQALTSWSRERVRRELEGFLAGRTRWPTAAEFAEGRAAYLRQAVVRFGGVEHWAQEFGLPLGPRQTAGIEWTQERVAKALLAIAGDSGRFPTRREIIESGPPGLNGAVGCGEDRLAWAERLGLEPSAALRQHRTVWTHSRIDTELRRLTRGRRAYLTRGEFIAAGAGRLHQVILNSPHGHDVWAARLGLERPTSLNTTASRSG